MATTSSPRGSLSGGNIKPRTSDNGDARARDASPPAPGLSTNLSQGDEENLGHALFLKALWTPSPPATPSNSPARSCSPLELPGPELSLGVPRVSQADLVAVTDSCSLTISPTHVSMALAPCPPLPWRREAGHGMGGKVTEGMAGGARAGEKAAVTTTASTRAGLHPTALANCASERQRPGGMETGSPDGVSSLSCSSSSSSASKYSSSTSFTTTSPKSSFSSFLSPTSSSCPFSSVSASATPSSAATVTTFAGSVARNADTRGGAGPAGSDEPAPCSPACAQHFARFAAELTQMKDQLFALSVQMEEQNTHITKLMEENRRYIRENGKLKSRTRGGVVNSASNYTDGFSSANNSAHDFNSSSTYSDGFSNAYSQEPNAGDLEDRLLALQLQNSELALCLEREKRMRREAETRLERDEGYIKRLEDSVQTLRGTRVVMDPITYRQVAEAYIAARRPPARRPHTHTGVPGSHLVCDGSAAEPNQRLSHPAMHTSSTTCESSYLYPSSSSSQEAVEGSPSLNGHSKKKGRAFPPQEHLSIGPATSVNGSMNPWDYQQLLESLEDLNGGSRGALS
ncbi:uncharacterized protein LOC134782882 [Penaeus indicus]|uniref:uncharacterized protein LOC134782882 n=1 Tax=Penaeus indicus TaxID=29960 RepID=UPI00300C7B1C